jgi:nucleotidyltransferase substrate binding protein (TIGR01987 family)
MTDVKPDISPLKRAIDRLDEGLTRFSSNHEDQLIRNGLIHRFEFTFEICHRMLKRCLEYASLTPDFDCVNFPDLIRSGNEMGLLLGTWKDWHSYRETYAKTSHSYDEDVALEVVGGIPKFLEEAQFLYKKLEEGLAK